jgi:hypothetical protein
MFLRDLGIVPGGGPASAIGEERASLTNLSPNLGRRGFLGGSGLFVLGLTLAGCNSYVEPEIDADQFNLADPGESPLTGLDQGDASPALWIAIEEDGSVKITCHRSEMGQQVWTSMAQIVADGKVWLRTTDEQTFVVIDAATNAILARVGRAEGSGAIRYTPEGIWTSAHDVETINFWTETGLDAD